MRSLKIRNFGKIKQAEIDIGSFTVLAGANNTGKSFVLKLLYSLLKPMNDELARDGLRNMVDSLKSAARNLPCGDPSTDFIDRKISEMETIFASFIEGGIRDFNDAALETMQRAKDIECILQRKASETQNEDRRGRRETLALAELSRTFGTVAERLEQCADEWKFVRAELRDRVELSLLRNFQVPRVYELKGERSQDLEASVDDLFRVIGSEKSFELDMGRSAFASFGNVGNVAYLESQIYWKLGAALRDARASRRNARELLTGVPEYFYDLVESLAFEYSDDMAYPEVYEALVNSDVLNGHISISKLGEMSFRENGRSRPMQMTSAGVANIGVLALLIERKVVDRGTMLFVDQPEAHLHPGWQVVMAEALFDRKRSVAGWSVQPAESPRCTLRFCSCASMSGEHAVQRALPGTGGREAAAPRESADLRLALESAVREAEKRQGAFQQAMALGFPYRGKKFPFL